MEEKSRQLDVPPSAPNAPPPGMYPYLQPDMSSQPPPPYSPQMVPYAQPTATVIMPVVYGRQSQTVNCPNCKETVNTKTDKNMGVLTYSLAAGLALFGCFFCVPCIGLIPFCVPQCKDVMHTCPNCNTRLGIFNRMRT